MVQKVFAIRDAKAEAYMPPFVAATRGLAVRMFGDVVRDPQGPFIKHPLDYALFELGEYDVLTGVLVALPGGPVYMFNGVDVNSEEV